MEKVILWIALITSVGLIVYWIRKPGLKDWLILFFFSCSYGTLLANLFIQMGLFTHLVRFVPELFETNLMFDCLFYPSMVVIYNQTASGLGLKGSFLQALAYSVPMSLFELWAERYTDLIEYHRWSIWYSFILFVLTFLLTKAFINMVRRWDPV